MDFSTVVVHEDGAVSSRGGLSEDAARWTFEAATRTLSVVYAHYSDTKYDRRNFYVRHD